MCPLQAQRALAEGGAKLARRRSAVRRALDLALAELAEGDAKDATEATEATDAAEGSLAVGAVGPTRRRWRRRGSAPPDRDLELGA